VAIASGPSAVHRSWQLSTSRGRFAVKVFDQDLSASSAEALEGPVRLESAAFAAGVPMREVAEMEEVRRRLPREFDALMA
jgi:hypothetical protein